MFANHLLKLTSSNINMPKIASPNLLLLCLFSLLAHGFLQLSCCYGSSSTTTTTTTREVVKKEDENHKIKGMFVFGSSLVDNGNNNFLQVSMAKADYSPYGIDFPLGPSGRFTNGKNVIDLLGDKLKLGYYIPPFTNPSTKGTKVVHGVNYASGGSGILDDTGSLAGQVISLSQQMRNFEEVTLPDLNAQQGCSSRESLPNYLFVVGTGGNDYSFNYFLRKSSSSNYTTSLEAFTSNLITKLSGQLKMMKILSNYKLRDQRRVVMASMAIHNLIRCNSPDDEAFAKAAEKDRGQRVCTGTWNPLFSIFMFLSQQFHGFAIISRTLDLYTFFDQRLYDMGGRKFVLMSLNPIGCTPMAKAVHLREKNNKGCDQKLNKAAHLFNTHLKSLVDVIKPQMPASNLVYVNSYKVIRDIIRNPSSTVLLVSRNDFSIVDC
ncbi:hypothetical protein RHMOL_Rhmol06G0143100 [Rhododendron molle]|uniref:Uncharacterized protein n=1 Tax=Rhododendron molle TaxID=49168 RepID=A0ACC0NDG8_RHOML|nr:hypothetical protein RHMOL_Rhmol06G0143100 [Rhododendron molle]